MMMTNDTSRPEGGRLSSAEHTRLSLVRAALALFGEKGFEATTTREIAARAGANIGSIAYHFGGKEGLRTACADHVVALIGATAGPIVDLEADDIAPGREEARAMLRRTVETMAGFVVARPEAVLMAQFIQRELAYPSAALDRIYEGIFAPVHKRLCRIWEAATDEPADSDATKLTIFTLIGQVVYFRIAGHAVARRMGWAEAGRREADAIAATVAGNLDAMLDARGARKDGS